MVCSSIHSTGALPELLWTMWNDPQVCT